MGIFAVAYYEVNRAYGGPEEGGWWYDTGRFVRLSAIHHSEEAADAHALRANAILDVIQRGKRDVGSVLYAGGRYRAEVYEGLPLAHYPDDRPFYE